MTIYVLSVLDRGASMMNVGAYSSLTGALGEADCHAQLQEGQRIDWTEVQGHDGQVVAWAGKLGDDRFEVTAFQLDR